MTGEVIYREAVYKAIEHFKPDSPEKCEKMIDCIPAAKIYTDEEIQKMQDLEQAQLDKAYEVGYQLGYEDGKLCNVEEIQTSRIEKALHGKTAEEQYEFMRWLLNEYGLDYNHSELARIAWLKGEEV